MASLLYLTSIGCTLSLCIYAAREEDPPSYVPLLIVVAVITQFIALLWYVSQPDIVAFCTHFSACTKPMLVCVCVCVCVCVSHPTCMFFRTPHSLELA
jgi:hypothetical protein